MRALQFVNKSTVLSDDDLAKIVAALQVQVSRDFAPIWDVDAKLSVVPHGQAPAPKTATMYILDDSDQAGALGYHDETADGYPLGKVFARTDKTYGSSISVTISHEVLELLADPYIDRTVEISSGNSRHTGYLYALEVCDACEDDSLGYQINGVQVSDFVTPFFFSPHPPAGAKLDFCGHISKPFQILKGGYLGVMKLTEAAKGWTQITAEGVFHRRGNAAPLGSRRERRGVGRREWQRSTGF